MVTRGRDGRIPIFIETVSAEPGIPQLTFCWPALLGVDFLNALEQGCDLCSYSSHTTLTSKNIPNQFPGSDLSTRSKYMIPRGDVIINSTRGPGYGQL